MSNLLLSKPREVTTYIDALYKEGITALKGGFTPQYVEELREDMMSAFWDAMQRPGGAVGRERNRWYVETHPQSFRGFVDLVMHPWVRANFEAVLGPQYGIDQNCWYVLLRRA